ncbi:MAG: energy transducer TonB [Verrucomicrobiota bacterium]
MVTDDEEDEGLAFLQKHRGKMIVAGVAILAGIAFAATSPKEAPKKKSSVNMVNIVLPLPPAPPPPPPPKEQPPEPETVKEEKFVPEDAPKPDPVAKAPDEAPMGTNLQGNGPNAFGLGVGSGGGMIGGKGTGKGGGSGSKYGMYAGQVQSSVAGALRNHKKTRSAALDVKVRIWVDATGRVTRATVSGTSGKPDLDAAIRDEILSGLQLQNPPPDGMPMPIVIHLSATRPN